MMSGARRGTSSVCSRFAVVRHFARDSLVRLSVGLEDPEDLERALLDALDTTA